MPAWLITLLLRYGVPLVLTILQRSGLVNAAEAWAARFGIGVFEDTKVSSAPTDFPNPPPENPATQQWKAQPEPVANGDAMQFPTGKNGAGTATPPS